MWKQLLSDGQNFSCMRLMALLACVLACILAVYGIIFGRELTGLSLLCGTFLGPAFGGKVIQTHLETRFDGTKPDDGDRPPL